MQVTENPCLAQAQQTACVRVVYHYGRGEIHAKVANLQNWTQECISDLRLLSYSRLDIGLRSPAEEMESGI
jgi:hypothetical protein